MAKRYLTELPIPLMIKLVTYKLSFDNPTLTELNKAILTRDFLFNPAISITDINYQVQGCIKIGRAKMGIDHSSLGILTVELPPEPEMGLELKAVAEVIQNEEGCDVVVDFSNANIVTSSSISKLLRLRKLLIDRGHRLILCNAAPATEGIFEVCGLDVVFEFAADEPAAFALIKKINLSNIRF